MCKWLIISALQNLLFCVPKAAVLHGKSVGFALQKSRFRNAKAQFYKITVNVVLGRIGIIISFLLHDRSKNVGRQQRCGL
ncbi:hypothetical protein [Prevotella intermedia]|uniref:hypothetical protein n=1 Tax=Prevotella intermedia TaxID=28131 RepID=UPI0009BCFC0E|nr:hypothetical protein [Prevotella intermedia]